MDRGSWLPTLVDDGTNAYLHSGSTLAAIDGSDDASYLLGDALGSVRGVTDDTGSLVGSTDYDVHGSTSSSSGDSTSFRYTGELFDDETGFTFLRARYLDPTSGRFTSADSVQPNASGTQGYNGYAYVGNNPTTWVDPSGHMVEVVTPAMETAELIDRWLRMRSLNAFTTRCAIDVPGCAGTVARGSAMIRNRTTQGLVYGVTFLGFAALICAFSSTVYIDDGQVVIGGCLGNAMKMLDIETRFGSPAPLPSPSPAPAPQPLPVRPNDPVRSPKQPKPRPETTCDQMGRWAPDNARMSDRAWQYQFFVSSFHSERPGMRFIAAGVSFDGCLSGVPMEAKGCRMDYIWTTFPGARSQLSNQLRRQSYAASSLGAPRADWFAAEEGAKDWILETARGEGLSNIHAFYQEAYPPCEG